MVAGRLIQETHPAPGSKERLPVLSRSMEVTLAEGSYWTAPLWISKPPLKVEVAPYSFEPVRVSMAKIGLSVVVVPIVNAYC